MTSVGDFSVGVLAVSAGDEVAAAALADDLRLPLCDTATRPRNCEQFQALLICSAQKLALQQTGWPVPGPVSVDFGSAAMRHRRRGGHNELLGKAIGLSKKPQMHVLDATAGLGRDSFILADLGCEVTLCERNEIVTRMLASGLSVAALSADQWLKSVVQRMDLHVGDARSLGVKALSGVDVIYLDPMFPDRDKSAKVKKEMALFHQLLGAGDDADALLLWALGQNVARVVVKRPPKAPELGHCKPSHTISGKAVRYDVYVLHGL
ncbi:MAG: class I SAM-dependent methyltransferase [Proteobacteria bacterium]|nr:class I SAM-dependent methyltransferase [Pseudomonadota bacterium]